MPEAKAKLRANVPDPRKPVDHRANEDVKKAMLEAMPADCPSKCKDMAVKQEWATWEIEDGACLKCYHALMEAGLV